MHFDLNSNIFLCCYASKTLRMKLLTWCRTISQAEFFWVGSGSGLSLSKYFGPAYKTFFLSNDFFLSWRKFVVLTAVTSVSEVIVIFLQLTLFANTAAFFYCLLGLISHSSWEGDSCEKISTRRRCVEKINHSRDSWHVLRSLQAGFSCLQRYPIKFFFMPIGPSWIVSWQFIFFLRNIIYRSIIVY